MKNYIYIILIIITILSFSLFSFSTGYNAHNLSNIAYVIALGLDKGVSSPLKLTIQLTKTSVEGGKQNSKNIVDSVECSSIESGIDLFNSHISRIVNLSQCKVIIISEELASEGIGQYISTFSDNAEMSPHSTIIISKSSASDFIDASEPVLEDLASKYYDLVISSNTYSGYTKSVSLIDFFSDYYDTFSQPSASLGLINTQDESPKLEIMGMAVFNKDKLVGELSILETICHMIISNELNSCKVQVPNPFSNDNSTIDVELKLAKNTKKSVSFINGSPYIKADINLQVKVLSIGESLNNNNSNAKNINSDANSSNNSNNSNTSNNKTYITKENLTVLESSINKYFSAQIENYLCKISKNYNCDIDGFGKYAVKYFRTTEDWKNYNWLNNFKNSFFEVNVKTSVKSGYTFM